MEDKEQVLKGRPWLFRRHLVLMETLEHPKSRKEIQFQSSPLWIRIAKIPPGCDRNHLVETVGASFGGKLDSEVSKKECRIKVLIDLRKPLRRCVHIAVEDDEEEVVAFTYDNLPNHCAGCGMLGHVLRDCNVCSAEQKGKPDSEQPYGIGLKSDWGATGPSVLKGLSFKGSSMRQRNYLAPMIATNRKQQRGERDAETEVLSSMVPETNEGKDAAEDKAVEDNPSAKVKGIPATLVGEVSQKEMKTNPAFSGDEIQNSCDMELGGENHGMGEEILDLNQPTQLKNMVDLSSFGLVRGVTNYGPSSPMQSVDKLNIKSTKVVASLVASHATTQKDNAKAGWKRRARANGSRQNHEEARSSLGKRLANNENEKEGGEKKTKKNEGSMVLKDISNSYKAVDVVELHRQGL